MRALKLEKSLNYPSTSQQYFSPDVDRKVQAFVAKNAEPSNSANSTPRAPDAQHQRGSPTLSGNSTASDEPRNSMQGLPQPIDDFTQLPSDEFQADVPPSLEQTAAAGMPGHLDCMPMMQLAAQAMGFHGGSADDMLAAGQMCAPWDQLALQMGMPASYEQVSCAQLATNVPYAHAQTVEEQQADDGLQQPPSEDQHEQVLAPQPHRQQPVDAATDDVRVMLALLAEILAEDEVQDPEALGAVAVSQPQLQEQPYLQQHGCSAGYPAAPAASYLQAGPAGSPSTPVTQGSPTYSMGQQAAASSAAHHQQHYALAAGPISGDPPQQAMLPSLSSCGEVVLFVDVTTKLMLQLYTQLTANTMQHAGLTAIQWMSDVRMSLSTPGFNTPGSSPSLSGDCSFGAAGLPFSVQCAVLHTCSSLVAVGAGGSADMSVGMAGSPFSSCFLVAVLEQVMKVLMSLRSLCAASCPSQGLSSAVLQLWQSQLQAQASTQVGQAVAALLGWVVSAAYA